MPREKVAFILHPSNLQMFLTIIKILKPQKQYSEKLILKLFEWIDSFKHTEFKSLKFELEKEVNAVMFLVPFIPEMKDYALHQVLKKVEGALSLAQKEGCTIAALAGFTSIVVQGMEKELSKKHGIRITSGNTTTAAIIIQSIEELSKKFSLNLATSTVSIIGASGDIGYGCFLYLAEKVKKVCLTARGIKSLEDKIIPIKDFYDCDIEITSNNNQAIKQSNIVIFVTSAYSTIYNLKDFAPLTIVCDASAPLNVATEGQLREDVFLYHGGIASLPFELDFGMPVGLAKSNHLHGCQTEGILGALHPELPCSTGRGNITRLKINKILKLMKTPNYPQPAYSLEEHTYTEVELQKYALQFKAN